MLPLARADRRLACAPPGRCDLRTHSGRTVHRRAAFSVSRWERYQAVGARRCGLRVERPCRCCRALAVLREPGVKGAKHDSKGEKAAYVEVLKLAPSLVILWTWVATAASVAILYSSITSFGTLSGFLAKGELSGVLSSSAFLVLAMGLRSLFLYLQDTLGWRAALVTVYRLRGEAFQSLLSQSAKDFDANARSDNSAGGLSHRLSAEADKAAILIHALVQRFVPGLVQMVGMVVRMLTLAPLLTCVTLLVVPLMGWVAGLVGENVRKMAKVDVEASATLASHISFVFAMFEFVVLYNARSYELERFSGMSRRILDRRTHTERMRAILPVLISTLYSVTVVILFTVGCWLISRKAISPECLVSFCTTLVFLIEPIQGISAAFNEVKQNQASLDRVLELCNRKHQHRPELRESYVPGALDVSIRDVSFEYERAKGREALRRCNLFIPYGKVVAVTGTSGSGKSTMAKLLGCLYSPKEGEVKIGGINVEQIQKDILYKQLCIVPQDSPLIQGTVLENLLYGDGTEKSRADLISDVEKVCQLVQIHEDIIKFPDGYETVISPYSSNLSGGQKQRLAIARALLRNPKILVLDESLSALDNRTAAAVVQGIERHLHGQTIIHIAHRLETVRNVDCIYVMENGAVVEEGEPKALKQKNGAYAKLLSQMNN